MEDKDKKLTMAEMAELMGESPEAFQKDINALVKPAVATQKSRNQMKREMKLLKGGKL